MTYICPLHGHVAEWPEAPCPGCLEKAEKLQLHPPKQEDDMSMEKRGVVANEHEKKAQKEVKKGAKAPVPEKAKEPKSEEK